jgi:hypothetical protein
MLATLSALHSQGIQPVSELQQALLGATGALGCGHDAIFIGPSAQLCDRSM